MARSVWLKRIQHGLVKDPFPTELEDETGEWIREKGFEFGTTTGRARRCGWLDTVIFEIYGSNQRIDIFGCYQAGHFGRFG